MKTKPASPGTPSARTEYTNASGIRPGEQYPKDKIAEIAQTLAAIADAKTKDEQFRSAIDKADEFLAGKRYEQARSEYQNALVIKPAENYPKSKVTEIDQILAEIAQQKSLDDQYAVLISQADKRLAEKSYTELSNQAMDQKGHDMFNRLAEEEHKHYRILMDVYWNLNNLGTWKW